MTSEIADAPVTGDWVGCLVLTIGPGAEMEWIAGAVGHAEEAVLADPVFGSMARVATVTGVDPLAGDLDDIATAVRRELLAWGLSPSRNPANRVTFGLLVVHPEPAEANTLVRKLAATSTLAQLPIVFLAGAPEPASPDQHAEVVRMVLDAVASTAQEIEKAPAFAIDVTTLRTLQAPQPTPDEVRQPEPEPGAPVVSGAAVRTSWWRSSPPRRPATGIDVIDELSRIADRVTMLYLVLVAEPVRPARRSRRRRLDVAAELGRAMLARGPAEPADHWYVRAFTADQRLHPGRPLPLVDHVRATDLPQRWGERFDVSPCVDDLRDNARLDRSSFVRRGLRRPDAVVVFVADGPPTGTDLNRQLTRLCGEARVVWVDFRTGAVPGSGADSEPDDVVGSGVTFLRDHEDVVGELVSLVTAPPTPPTPPTPPSGTLP